MSFGGSYRTQVEAFVNEQFSTEEDQNDYWFLNRFMLHGHYKLANKFELFAELNSSLITSKESLVRVDRDELSVNQLFARYYVNNELNVFVGRQNVRLGSGRLVDVREGPNVRLAFDMAQVEYQKDKTSITAFHALRVKERPGIFDNDYLENDETLSALYWTQNWSKSTNTDIYFLYKTEDGKTFDAGTDNDERASVGLRHFGEWKGFNFNNEFVYQFGKFGDRDISAWTASFNIEKELDFGSIGLKTELISGNDNDSNSLNTFDALYPRGAYFGRVARIGPSNLIDIHPYFDTRIGKVNIELDYVAFWRFSVDDGVYNAPLLLEYPDTNDQRFIGHQIGTITGYELNEFINLEFETNLIFPGDFLIESNLNDTLFHAVLTAEFKF
ncbi:alginate export family protein [Aquimarina sp. U1-2]|nr:alginate export family protein [Aquimarina sp. U1-2]